MSVQEAIKAAEGAGFQGDEMIEIVAISGLESGWRADATNDTRRYSERRADGRWYVPGTDDALPFGVWPEYSVGPLQINLNVHESIAEWEARWWPTAFAFARQLFLAAGSFRDWSTARLVTDAERNVVRHALDLPHPDPVVSGGPEGAIELDAVQSTRLLQAVWQLVAHGARLRVDAIEGTTEIAIAVDVQRGDLLATGVEGLDFLPG